MYHILLGNAYQKIGIVGQLQYKMNNCNLSFTCIKSNTYIIICMKLLQRNDIVFLSFFANFRTVEMLITANKLPFVVLSEFDWTY